MQDGRSAQERRAVVIRQADVERLAAPDNLRECAHRLLERHLGIHAVVVEDVDVVEVHAPEALVEARDQVLAAAPVTVGAGPHVVTGFRRDDELVAVGAEEVVHEAAEVPLGAAVGRPVVVGEVEVGDAVVKRCAAERLHRSVVCRVAEVVPESQRNARQAQPAPAAVRISHCLVTRCGSRVCLADIHCIILQSASIIYKN